MDKIQQIIDPERVGLWTAVTFIIALLAFVLALVGLSRSSDLMYMTQGEVMLLNKKIETVKGAATPSTMESPDTPSMPDSSAK
jgi:cell division protein FtsL